MITESVVIAILLAAFIYGAVSTSTSMGACERVEVEEGDGDDAEEGETVAGNGGRAGTACALTKGATGLTVSLLFTIIAKSCSVDGWTIHLDHC
jgi:hypothetical protein